MVRSALCWGNHHFWKGEGHQKRWPFMTWNMFLRVRPVSSAWFNFCPWSRIRTVTLLIQATGWMLPTTTELKPQCLCAQTVYEATSWWSKRFIPSWICSFLLDTVISRSKVNNGLDRQLKNSSNNSAFSNLNYTNMVCLPPSGSTRNYIVDHLDRSWPFSSHVLMNRSQQEEDRDTFLTIISPFLSWKSKHRWIQETNVCSQGREAGRSADKNRGKEQVYGKNSAAIKFAQQLHLLEYAEGSGNWEAGSACVTLTVH